MAKNEEIQNTGEMREPREEVQPNGRKLGVGGGYTWVQIQFCSSAAVRAYSTSLSLNSLSSKIILVAELL